MRKEKRWHRDYWEDVGGFKRVKITRDRFTLYVLCCILLLLYLRKIGGLQLTLCCVPNVYLILFFVQLIVHNCCSVLVYVGFSSWAKFTGVVPQFACRKTIREERHIVSPYLSFRPYFLPSSHMENLDFCEIWNGGPGRFGSKKIFRPVDIR